jgi:hypothetical protein
MAFGDIGGPVTELVITCKSQASGDVNISKGDAVRLTGDFTVSNNTGLTDIVFGQAMADIAENNTVLPIKVRGICIFGYVGSPPRVNGEAGVLAADMAGKVKAPKASNGVGINLRVSEETQEVHVLL